MKALPLNLRGPVACALAAMQLVLGFTPVGAQQPDTLKQFIPPPALPLQGHALLGSSVAVDGDYTVAGAPLDDLGAEDSGVVKVFDTTTGALRHVLPNPGSTIDRKFGSPVAISGTRVVVGAYWDDSGATDTGRVHVYDLAGANPERPVMTLNNPSPGTNDYFGHSVAISGTMLVVGAYGDDAGGVDSGSVYVYDLAGPTPTQPVMTLSNPAVSASDHFGWSVSITGERVAVGAPGDSAGAPQSGSVYVYDLGGTTPHQALATLNNPGVGATDQFGWSVAITGTHVVVGVPFDDSGGQDAGTAYVYNLDDLSQPSAVLNNPSPEAGDNFGYSVSLSGVRAVVGAYGDNTGGSRAGLAYVYNVAGMNPEQPEMTLNNPDAAAGDWFGYSVAISGTRVVVGAPYDDLGAPNAGSVYVYEVEGGSPGQPVATLNNPGSVPRDEFGYSVAVAGTRVVVGAYRDDTGARDAGSVHVYDLTGANPAEPVLTLNNPQPATAARFGESVSISGTRVAVGTPYHEGQVGIVYVYDLAGANPGQPVATLRKPSGSDRFGEAVAISGTRVVVGVRLDDTGAEAAGSAYVYDLEAEDPALPVATLNNPDPAVLDRFGTSVAISGTRVVVGTPYDATEGLDAGRVYVYDLEEENPAQPVATLVSPDGNFATFGWSLAIDGSRLVVGARGEGTAYVYDLAGANPAQPMELENPGIIFWFGNAVAISGTRVVVGAYQSDSGAPSAGSAYVYDLAGTNPAQPVATLNNPDPAEGDSFGWSVAVDGATAVIGVRYDDSVAFNKGAVYVFGPAVAEPTVLTEAATNLTVTGATLRGTINPTGAETTYSFEYRLAGSSEPRTSAPANTDILQGYTPVPVSVAISGLLPNTEYEFWLTATNSEGTVTAGPQSFTTLADTIPPVITAPQGGFSPLTIANGPAAAPNYLSQATATDNVEVISFTQSPAPGAVLPVGVHTITLTALDAAGNSDIEGFSVTVLAPAGLTYATLYEKGGPVPTAGNDLRIQEGAVWTSVGIPAVSASGAVAHLGKWKAAATAGLRTQTGSGIFVDDTLAVKIGDPVPGISGATFRSFKAPVIDADGRVAFIATIRGADVTKENDSVVLSAGRTGTLEVIAREGSPAPGAGNATYRSFSSVSVQGAEGSGTVFVATLLKASGTPAVDRANDAGAWWQPAGEEAVQLLVREGDPGWSSGETIKTFQVLKSASGITGHGRGQIDGARALIQVGLSTGRQAQALATPGSLTLVAMTGDPLGGTALPEAEWARMNLPSFGNDGASIAVLGALKSGVGGVLSANAKGIFASNDGGETWEPVARTGSIAPGFGGVAAFGAFKDPVNSSTGAGLAFIGTAKGGAVTALTNNGIWWQPEGEPLALLAREGDQPPGAPAGAQWKAFTSLALPGGETGPLFTATLVRGTSAEPGPGGITSIDDLGLYSADASGTVTELLRENQPLLGKTVKNFHVLRTVSGSAGTTRAFNHTGTVVLQVTYTDRSTGIVRIALP